MSSNFGRALLSGALFVVVAGCMPGTARAQTAADLNRANQALQICMSPMGASIPECSQLKQQVGVGAAPAGTPAGGAAGILGALAGARGGNAAGVAGLLGALANSASAAKANTPAAPALPVTAPVGSGDYYVQSANGTQAAAAGYQACVTANPTNWQPCLAILNGGAPVAAPVAPVGAPVGLSAVAMAGYNRCLTSNPGQEAKCAAAYGGGVATAPAAAPATGAGAVASAASAAQTARSLAPTVRALGSLLGR